MKVLWLGLWMVLAAVAAHAQSPVVQVHAVVKDRKGNPARDLAAKDFRVWEDNQEQSITSVSLEKEPAGKLQKRCLVFFFDNFSISSSAQVAVRQEAAKAVDASAGPNRYMAVINFGGNVQVAQAFTTDAARLKPAVLSPQAVTNASGGEASTYVLPNLRAGLKMVAESLAPVRGRKALVLIGGGYPTSREAEDQLGSVMQACNRANLAIYAVDAAAFQRAGNTGGGGGTGGGSGGRGGGGGLLSTRFEETSSSQGLLKALADGTGGFLIADTIDVAGPIGEIAREQDEYYLLSYTPAQEPDGACHTLRVRVNRGGVDVRARKGYCSAKPLDLLAGNAVAKDLESRAAGASAGNMAASAQAPFFYTAPHMARVHVALEIATSAIQFEKLKGKPHAELNLAGVAYRPDGAVAARFSDTVKLDFQNGKEAEAFTKQPLHYENQFPLASGQYNFRVAFSAGREGFGKLELPLVVEPYDARALALSALALSKDRRPAGGLVSGLDDSLVEGGGRLVAKGVQIVPTGTNRFRRTDACSFYFEIYEPLLAGPNPPAVEFQIRVVDRKTGEVKGDTGKVSAASFIRAGNPVVPVVFNLPIASLPPGSYRAEVQAARAAGAGAVVRAADFEVE